MPQWFPTENSVFLFPNKFITATVLELLANKNNAVKIPSNLGQNALFMDLFSKAHFTTTHNDLYLSISPEGQFGVTCEARGRSNMF